MSKTPSEKKEKIDLQALVARAGELRNIIAVLEEQVTRLTEELTELKLAETTLKGLSGIEGDTEALVALDRLATVFVPAVIPGSWGNSVLVNIGRNYYAKLSREAAEKILARRIDTLEKIIGIRRRELNQAINEYNYLQQVLQAVYVQLQQSNPAS